MIIEEMIYSRPGDKIPTQRKDSKLERNCIQLMEGKIEIEYEWAIQNTYNKIFYRFLKD